MEKISDAYMMGMFLQAKPYTIVQLHDGPQKGMKGEENIIWEHGRRNFALREKNLVDIVCPVTSNKGLAGIAVFNATEEQVRMLMEDDPAIKAGIFTYEIHSCMSLPGDTLK